MVAPRVTIELVPNTAWGVNVRSEVSAEEWDIIRKKVYRAAGYKCEICGGVGDKWPVECHEVWHYDDEHHAQTLVRMIALCPACHAVKHMGRSFAVGKGSQALVHLAAVNGWSVLEAARYYADAFDVWEERSRHKWRLDLSALQAYL